MWFPKAKGSPRWLLDRERHFAARHGPKLLRATLEERGLVFEVEVDVVEPIRPALEISCGRTPKPNEPRG